MLVACVRVIIAIVRLRAIEGIEDVMCLALERDVFKLDLPFALHVHVATHLALERIIVVLRIIPVHSFFLFFLSRISCRFTKYLLTLFAHLVDLQGLELGQSQSRL